MWVDARTLHEFYTSPLGKNVSHLISDQLQKIWHNLSGKRVLGIGYALPYLEDFKGKAERRIALFPGNLGAIHWHAEGNKNRSALTEEAHFPLTDNSIDCILIVHALEYTHIPPVEFLKNIWRILTGSGKLIIVVPNR
ncbi:uncharacterized protein LOC111320343, partial [Stylophora pistillata]|uniref:uncharacterized protein LOC111320343 n=1 Tax=Stylophora pistillata TaxID=50429 RepID=UPI000C057418